MAKCTKKKSCSKKQQQSLEERAYFKWMDAGCPGSDGIEFWLAAEQEDCEEAAETNTEEVQ